MGIGIRAELLGSMPRSVTEIDQSLQGEDRESGGLPNREVSKLHPRRYRESK
jgi:hypothetical protein